MREMKKAEVRKVVKCRVGTNRSYFKDIEFVTDNSIRARVIRVESPERGRAVQLHSDGSKVERGFEHVPAVGFGWRLVRSGVYKLYTNVEVLTSEAICQVEVPRDLKDVFTVLSTQIIDRLFVLVVSVYREVEIEEFAPAVIMNFMIAEEPAKRGRKVKAAKESEDTKASTDKDKVEESAGEEESST